MINSMAKDMNNGYNSVIKGWIMHFITAIINKVKNTDKVIINGVMDPNILVNGQKIN